MTVPDDLELPAGSRLVHIGPPKTGTTAIQRALHKARPELREHGVCFPGDTARPRDAGWAIVGAGLPRGRPKPTMEDWYELVREVEAAGEQRVVVSNESFALAYYKAVREIVAGLGGERIHVVYVVRRIDKLLNSHWQQRVQAGLTMPFDEWLQIVLGDPDPKDSHWRGFWRHHSLSDVMNRWIGAAGADKVTLVVADESDRDLMPRLFERLLGLPSELLRLESSRSNRSLSLNEIELLRRVHARGAERQWSDHALRHLIQFGVVAGLARSERRENDRRIALPPWAAKRASQINDERIDLVRSLGVRVIGDPELLRSTPDAGDEASASEDVWVAADVAAQAVAAAIDAGERRRHAAIEGGDLRVAETRAQMERETEERSVAREAEWEAEIRQAREAEAREAEAREAEAREAEAREAEAREAASPEHRRVEDVTSRDLLKVVRARARRRLGAP